MPDKKILIVIITLLLALIGGGYFIVSKTDLTKTPKNNIQESNQVSSIQNVDKEAEKIFLDKEIQLKIDFLNKSLKPNYLKITDYQESKSLLGYKDPNVTWFVMKISYDITDASLADYDININKGSISELDYKSKGQLYKDNLKRKLKNIYYKSHGYDRFVKTGLVGYLTKKNNVYTMYELGDYLDNTFKNKTQDIDVLSKIAILKDYFNYFPIYFDKDPKEIKKILDEVKGKLNDKDFNIFYKALNTIFFNNINQK